MAKRIGIAGQDGQLRTAVVGALQNDASLGPVEIVPLSIRDRLDPRAFELDAALWIAGDSDDPIVQRDDHATRQLMGLLPVTQIIVVHSANEEPTFDEPRFADAPAVTVSPETGDGLEALLSLLPSSPPHASRPAPALQTQAFDARLTWVDERRQGLRVRVSLGADEAIGRVYPVEGEPELSQIRFDRPVMVGKGQPIVVRQFKTPAPLAGGRIVNPQVRPSQRAEPKGPISIGDPKEAILREVGDDPNGKTTEAICRALGRTAQDLGDAFEALRERGEVLGFAGLWIAPAAFAEGSRRFLDAVRELHGKTAQQATVSREKAAHLAGLTWAGKPLDRILAALAEEGRLVVSGITVRDPGFRSGLKPRQRALLDRVRTALDAEPVNTPHAHDLAKTFGLPAQAVEEIFRLGIETGEIVQLDEQVFYTTEGLERIKGMVRDAAGRRPFTKNAMRDALGTTRKYVIPILEHFDSVGFTVRDGDERRVKG